MNSVDTKLKLIEPFLQKNVVFNIGTKSVRKGKLLLFNIKDYYLKFIIKTSKGVNKTYEIPYPYDITSNKDSVRLTYKLIDLCCGNVNKVEKMLEYDDNPSNKLFDSAVVISNIDKRSYK